MATDWRMIRLEKDGPLAIVTLTNPPLNVLHPHMAAELDACFTGLASDADVVVAIVTGEGERAFCAGFDIKEFPNLMAPGAAERLTRVLHASLGKIAHLGKPTIAAVNGLALGGGLELSMACDLRIVAANAQLGQPARIFAAIFRSLFLLVDVYARPASCSPVPSLLCGCRFSSGTIPACSDLKTR